jgi:predicted anti-sigma-YlaC factor YlaD
MNCSEAESLLPAGPSGGLSAVQHTALAEHLAACPACRQTQAALSDLIGTWRNEAASVSVPPAAETWTQVRARRYHLRRTQRANPIFWLGLPLSAAATVAFVFLTPETVAPETARAEFVETGDAAGSTMVYVDKESGWLVVWAVDTAREQNG